MHHRCFRILAPAVCLLAACRTEPEKARAIGEAFVGPAMLALRSDLSARSEQVATLRHGEKLEVLQMRRRFLKVRNLGGVEGWVDGRYLLSTGQMAEMERASARAANAPSQGRATVYEILNVHTEPNRQSPSPHQIAPGVSVDVLEHMVAPRIPYQPGMTPLITSAPKSSAPRKVRKKTKGQSQEEKAGEEETLGPPPPPMPPAPKLPENWEELSKLQLPGSNPALKYDDWSLIRLPDRKVGWVLTRMLIMAIPDEVAQYAEGKRITAYFPLGELRDGDQTKHHWLWTTISEPLQQHDFDSFRIFIYNARRHRYETAYIEHDVRGYHPVLTMPVEVIQNKKTVQAAGFSLVTEDKAGQRWRRTFAFQGYRLRTVKKEAVAGRVQPSPASVDSAQILPPPGPGPEKPSLLTRVKQFFSR